MKYSEKTPDSSEYQNGLIFFKRHEPSGFPVYCKLSSHWRSLHKAPGRVACREYCLSLKPHIPAQGMATGFPQPHSSSLGLLDLAVPKTTAESSNLNHLPKPRNSLIDLRTTQRPNQVSLTSWLCFGEILSNSKCFLESYWVCCHLLVFLLWNIFNWKKLNHSVYFLRTHD